MKPATRQDYSADRSADPIEGVIEGVKVGTIACLNDDHSVCVDFNGNTRKNLKARVVKSLDWNSLLIIGGAGELTVTANKNFAQ